MKIALQRVIFLGIFFIVSVGSAFAQTNNNSSLESRSNDMLITTKIKTQLAADPLTKAGLVTVETNNGIVKLMGIVDSQTEGVAAIQIAQSTKGVIDVDTSALYVKGDTRPSSQPIQDAYITAKVKGELIKEKLINRTEIAAIGIKVETKNGIVYLTGKVKNANQRQTIIKAVKSIYGVTQIVPNLTVE